MQMITQPDETKQRLVDQVVPVSAAINVGTSPASRQSRINELLQHWANWQTASSSSGARDMAPEITTLINEIDKLASIFRRVITLEYLDSRPQKTKAAMIGIPREAFSTRVHFIHEQLDFAVFPCAPSMPVA